MDIQVESLPEDKSAAVASNPDDSSHLMLSGHFDIPHPTKEEDAKLREIWLHGMSLSRSGDFQDVLWQVMNLRRSLGAPRLGESPLDKVYRWAKLKRQQEQIEHELRQV